MRLELLKQKSATSEIHEELDHLRSEWRNLETEIAPLRAAQAEVEAVLAEVERFVAAAVTSGDGGCPPIVAAALGEKLDGSTNGITHVLFVEASSAGGETITRQSWWRRTPEVVYVGGAGCRASCWT